MLRTAFALALVAGGLSTPATALQSSSPLVHVDVSAKTRWLESGDSLVLRALPRKGRYLDGMAYLFVALDDPIAAAATYPDEIPDALERFVFQEITVHDHVLEAPVVLPPGIERASVSAFVAWFHPTEVILSPMLELEVFGAPPGPGGAGGVDPASVAVFYNEADPDSVALASYYAQRRGLPPGNVIGVSLNADNVGRPALSEAQFVSEIQPALDALPAHVDLIALAWSRPFRVISTHSPPREASITSAFTFGLEPGFYEPRTPGGCVRLEDLAPSPMYDRDAHDYGAMGLRPTMMLGGESAASARALVDRGLASDATHPTLKGLLVYANPARSRPRDPDAREAMDLFADHSRFELVRHEIGNAAHPVDSGVMLYQTGDWTVENVQAIGFVPGAVADHLTSFGGNLLGIAGQMTALEWLEAGATGSYGTIREPCATARKFPRTSVLLRRYYQGESLGAAYLKSIEYPSEGLLLGDPAATPYAR